MTGMACGLRSGFFLLLTISLLGGCSAGKNDDLPDPGPDIEPILDSLEGLELGAFFEESFEQLGRRSPELITELGLDEALGMPGDALDNISDAYERNTQRLEAGILDLLQSYDREALGPQDRVSFDVYDWYLDDRVRSHRWMYHGYPVTHMLSSVQRWTAKFFTDIQPFTTHTHAENYVTRLGQVERKFQQLIEGLRLREQAGVIPPRLVTEWALYGVRQLAGTPAVAQPVYTIFAEKLETLQGLSEGARSKLLEAALEAVETSFLPAHRELEIELARLEGLGLQQDGVWQHPDGDAYYTHLVRHYTSTDMTAEEVHQLGLAEVARIRAEMDLRFAQLGYPPDESLAQLFDRVSQDGGFVAGDEVISTYEAIIDQAEAHLEEAFDVFPDHEVVVIGGNSGGFYIPGALDGSRPGAFYANDSGTPEPRYAMASLAYHEAVPGHHFQITIAQELDLPPHRTNLTFTVYAEGWALYIEQLAQELGWYEGDVFGDLGRLQYEVFRAARLVVDTGLHAKRWTFQEAQTYLEDNVGFDPKVLNLEYQVARYVAMPGQALAYKVGMQDLLRLRQRAQDELGAAYDLKAFHRAVLTSGSLPLPILETVVDEYIQGVLPGG